MTVNAKKKDLPVNIEKQQQPPLPKPTASPTRPRLTDDHSRSAV